MALEEFHPSVKCWFLKRFEKPSDCQNDAWASIRQHNDTLVAAPTGSGKTLSAFLSAINDLVEEAVKQPLPCETRILYISPLKALSNDIERNLAAPLEGIRKILVKNQGIDALITTHVRTGDTPAHIRTQISRKNPHILVTTPESLFILLTSESGRKMLSSVRTVIVDEIHVLVSGKRGAHLALSLQRLDRLTAQRPQRIGLSATQHPIDVVGNFLTGGRKVVILDKGRRRAIDLDIEIPTLPLESVLPGESLAELYDRIAELIRQHRISLVFVNTRRLAERIARGLTERLGENQVATHHGSMSKEQRLSAESRLKSGKIKGLVATASMELGIDVGDVDLVIQFGSTRSIATLIQRVGRSGHKLAAIPKGRIFPTSRDELMESLALVKAVREGDLDRIQVPEAPTDILAQHVVAIVACESMSKAELFEMVKGAWPYQNLAEETFNAVITMLVNGYSSRWGTRGAYLYEDLINDRLIARKGARLTALTCGGAIPDTAEYRVIVEPEGEVIGSVDEDFAIDSMSGDIFQLGNSSWRVLRIQEGTLRVADAKHLPPSIPFWFGEAPGRSWELSSVLSSLRQALSDRLVTDHEVIDTAEAEHFLQSELQAGPDVARQAANYLAIAKKSLGVLPTMERIVFERFFDESGGMQFIIHAPFGSRINRGWGLALRKRFCRSFNFELQAAATEDALILSLGTAQSFELKEVVNYLSSKTVKALLIQALLDAPMFLVRWRWNAVCSLALKRFQGGRKTPPHLLRMQSEDLVTAVFPEQLACLENIVGDREIPDHPLVNQTISDCLEEAMDIDRLILILEKIESGSIEVVCRDLVEPSPLAAAILNARAFNFLDGAPLEERRTRAVSSRRWLNPREARDLGQLDTDAISRVRLESEPDFTSPDSAHAALLTLGIMRESLIPLEDRLHLEALREMGRAKILPLTEADALWFATERVTWVQALIPLGTSDLFPSSVAATASQLEDAVKALPASLQDAVPPEEAIRKMIAGHLQHLGPTTQEVLAARLMLPLGVISMALQALETQGFLFKGQFTGDDQEEFCERGLLARIHRLTINRLRRAIEPVSGGEFMDFLLRWQKVHPDTRQEGPQALSGVLAQLEGFDAPAVAWERDILPSRIANYEPEWLDNLCLTGKVAWARIIRQETSGLSPVKTTPITFCSRRNLSRWLNPALIDTTPSSLSQQAGLIKDLLSQRGALFLDELIEDSGFLRSSVEASLAELIARGQVTSDSYAGLRALLIPEQKKRRFRHLIQELENAGRWVLSGNRRRESTVGREEMRENLEHITGVLLSRYGILFKGLLSREHHAPGWTELLPHLRSLEARGDIRGGRFVAGQAGEQFALPAALDFLRALKNKPADTRLIILSAADPCCLQGIANPAKRISALPGNRVAYINGCPVATLSGGEIEFLKDQEDRAWEIQNALFKHIAPARLSGYLN